MAYDPKQGYVITSPLHAGISVDANGNPTEIVTASGGISPLLSQSEFGIVRGGNAPDGLRVRVLAARGAPLSITGTTTKTVLYDLLIPAGTIGANSILQITPSFIFPNSANTKTVEVAIGVSTSSLTFSWSRGRTTSVSEIPLIQLRSKGSLFQQEETYSAASNYATNVSVVPGSKSIDFSTDQHLYCFGTLQNSTEMITLSSILVTVYN